MREELLRVLDTKLDNIKVNIESLMELNGKIDDENKKLSYIDSVLNMFKRDNGYDILNFTNLTKENFDNVVEILGGNIKDMFKTNSCNYDGLVYLINGINNGVSLSLTLEQENAINYFIQGMEGKREEYEAVIDGLLLVKDHFEVADVDLLKERKANYENVLDKFNKEEYINETDEIMEAIEFSKTSDEKTIDLLTYLLKYNSEIYEKNKNVEKVYDDSSLSSLVKEENEDSEEVPEFEEPISSVTSDTYVEPVEEKKDEFEEFHFPEFENIEKEEVAEERKEEEVVVPTEEVQEENIFVPEISTENEKVSPLPVVDPIPMPEVSEAMPSFEPLQDTNVSVNENSDFEGIVNEDDYEEYNVSAEENKEIVNETVKEEDESVSTRELQRLFKEYDVRNLDSRLNELLHGSIDNYRDILSLLKENELVEEFEKNEDLFKEVLTNSTKEDLQDILDIIKNELSVDDEDYKMTLKIAINTIPSIFVRDDGNYENFARNVKMFKEMGINLISLFDFSKEVFIADHNTLLKNYNTVKKYNVNLDYNNLKYYLMIPNVEERLDYYVESNYIDRTKNNERFDGVAYIKDYPAKINVVSDETIKRLRYSSENSKKVFGNKPNSLAGEITNLRVNVLDISPEYMNRFFDNKFDIITPDEVREYVKLCHNSSNVKDFTNEIINFEKYHNGLKYVIGDINVSYNKVARNYNILRSYGIDKKKALLFAVCYNLVITNDEYKTLKEVVERDGE